MYLLKVRWVQDGHFTCVLVHVEEPPARVGLEVVSQCGLGCGTLVSISRHELRYKMACVLTLVNINVVIVGGAKYWTVVISILGITGMLTRESVCKLIMKITHTVH